MCSFLPRGTLPSIYNMIAQQRNQYASQRLCQRFKSKVWPSQQLSCLLRVRARCGYRSHDLVLFFWGVYYVYCCHMILCSHTYIRHAHTHFTHARGAAVFCCSCGYFFNSIAVAHTHKKKNVCGQQPACVACCQFLARLEARNKSSSSRSKTSSFFF